MLRDPTREPLPHACPQELEVDPLVGADAALERDGHEVIAASRGVRRRSGRDRSAGPPRRSRARRRSRSSAALIRPSRPPGAAQSSRAKHTSCPERPRPTSAWSQTRLDGEIDRRHARQESVRRATSGAVTCVSTGQSTVAPSVTPATSMAASEPAVSRLTRSPGRTAAVAGSGTVRHRHATVPRFQPHDVHGPRAPACEHRSAVGTPRAENDADSELESVGVAVLPSRRPSRRPGPGPHDPRPALRAAPSGPSRPARLQRPRDVLEDRRRARGTRPPTTMSPMRRPSRSADTRAIRDAAAGPPRQSAPHRARGPTRTRSAPASSMTRGAAAPAATASRLTNSSRRPCASVPRRPRRSGGEPATQVAGDSSRARFRSACRTASSHCTR